MEVRCGPCDESCLLSRYVVVVLGFPVTVTKYISRMRNTAMICSDKNESNEAMLQNIQSLRKQNMNSIENMQ
jgi:hypothetical protein